MKYFSLVLLVVLAASPLSTTANVLCIGVGTYTANSTYEANLRRLASILPAEISSSPQSQGLHALGYWPNRLRATWTCFGGSSSSCSACIAAGFQESEGECPYSKEFFFSGGDDCQLHVVDFRAFERFFRPTLTESVAVVVALQAVAFAFLLFLFLQEWRHRSDDKAGFLCLLEYNWARRFSPLPSADK